jgi:hypothetical protein
MKRTHQGDVRSGGLRSRGERPCHSGTGNDFDEIASSHYSPQGSGARRYWADYSSNLRQAKWVSGVRLHGGNRNALMFTLGQKQTSDCRLSMSALPPKADMRRVVARKTPVKKGRVRFRFRGVGLFWKKPSKIKI